MSDLQVEFRKGTDTLDELRAEWQALHRVAQAAPFLAWEWMATWQQWLNPHGMPVLLCAREAGKLIGMLALNAEPTRVVGLPVQRLSLLGAGFGGADYLDVLALPGREAEVTAAILSFLTRHVSFDALELEGLDAQSPSLSWLANETKPRFQYRPNPQYVCPQIDLSAGWASVLRSSRRADNFKRRLRQLRGRDGFAFRVVTEPDEAVAAFDRFLQLHEARWAEAGGSEMTGHARLQNFQRALVLRWAEAGLLRFDELWVEGACRASIYGLEHSGCYYFYNSGYDQAWRNASVGLVALGLSIQAAIERGATVYDFLRGTESYKFDWTGTTRATVTVRLAPQRPRARFFFHWQQTSDTLRRSVREAFPASLLAPLQQARRAWVRKQELDGAPAAVPLTQK
ncbi:MAG TPA: GNAT family N-acetyltransferase [Blastocatellia bacterium]|nr:GNAT family N-acetyltransferase [Blastocatellia bacterium]